MPLSNVARKKLVKRFPDREITVGMDTALIVGHPSVIAPALLLIPDCDPCRGASSVTALCRWAIYRSSCSLLRAWCRFSTATLSVPGYFHHPVRRWSVHRLLGWLRHNEVFQKFGTNPDASVMYSSRPSANPFTGLFAALSHVGIAGYALAAVLLLSVGYLLKQKSRRQLKAGSRKNGLNNLKGN